MTYKINKYPKVSVLMAVYIKDDPSHLASALDSLKPFVKYLISTVVVADGGLSSDLEEVLASRAAGLKIKLIRLPKSVGLGEALNTAVKCIECDYVLRMDADDISRPERMDLMIKQLQATPDVDVIGSQISEFESDPRLSKFLRIVPLNHDDIYKKMKFRSSMNHVSCLIKRQAILDVGGYEGGRGFSEDWFLWGKMIVNGKKFLNLPDVLVDVRIGNGFVSRRSGLDIFRQDVKLIQGFLSIGFLTKSESIILFFVKLIQRLCPHFLLKFAYRLVRMDGSKQLVV